MRLTAVGLRYRYSPNSAEVLAGVDLTVEPGESVALVGPSGSGKTTLLALLGGLLAVQAGQVTVEDEQGRTYRPSDYVAWVPQTVNVLGDRTAIDNVVLGAFSSGLRRREACAQAEHWLAEVGLAGRGEEPVRLLSGGELQRVVIARALASQRPLLFADEPTGQLDAATTASVAQVLLDGSHGRSVVLVTHDPELARRCDRILRLRNGLLHPETATNGPEPVATTTSTQG